MDNIKYICSDDRYDQYEIDLDNYVRTKIGIWCKGTLCSRELGILSNKRVDALERLYKNHYREKKLERILNV